MFKRLLTRLFGRKQKPAAQRTSIVTGVVTNNPRVVAFSSRQASRRDDISDPLHPLNPLNPLNPVSPIYVDTTTLGDSCRRETMAFGGSDHHHHHHSSSHDSGSYDSGSYDSGSSSSSCD